MRELMGQVLIMMEFVERGRGREKIFLEGRRRSRRNLKARID